MRCSWPVVLLLLCSAGFAAERVVLVAGGGTEPPGVAATKVKLDGPFGVDFDSQGRMVIVEIAGHRVLRVGTDGILSLIGGTGEKGFDGDGGPATKAKFNSMHSVAIGRDDTIYVADTLNHRIRKIDPPTGTISTVADPGGGVYCIAFDAARENLHFVDLDNKKLHRVNVKTGMVSHVAGSGQKGIPKDGSAAVSAPLVDPRAVAVDGAGNVYVLERSGHALRVVDREGKIRTVAGTGKAGLSGDDGDALQATLNGPKHLCIDLDQTVLIADTESHVIRRYDPKSGKITRVAGTGEKGTGGVGGDPLKVQLAQPHGVWIGPDRDIYISDSTNNRILKIERGQGVKRVGRDATTGGAGAVVVPNEILIQTAQLFPGTIPELKRGLASQWDNLWQRIPKGNLVRLNVYVVDQESLADVKPLLASALGPNPPVVTLMVGKLAEPDALVAADAVVSESGTAAEVSYLPTDERLRCAIASVTPPGGRLFISGQAEKGDLRTATRATLESLERTLKMHGLEKRHTAHVKAFVTPIAEAAVVREEMEKFFGKGTTPPLVMVEWTSTLPIEIELVAWAGPARSDGPNVEYLGAPGLTDSPVYSRAARVNHGPLIYLAGLHATGGGTGEAEVTEIFSQLDHLLHETGSDFRHLVKATYYVTTANDASAKLNELRPKYYDPKRPPAASKAQVAGTGHPQRALTLDMIAVPAK